MGLPDHLTCLLRSLNAGQETTVKTRHGTTDWFQTGKGVHQGCIWSPGSFNLYAEYIMRNAGLEEDLQDLLELTPKKDVLFILGDWNAKVGSQETPGVTSKFGLGMQNEAGQRLIEFCQKKMHCS